MGSLTYTMLAAATQIVLAALAFWGQDVPGLRVGQVRPFSGEALTNYRQSDFNGDGNVDLLLPGRMLLQVDGGFPEDAVVPLPDWGGASGVDVWQDKLFFRLSGRLAVLRWDNGAWDREIEQALDWPGNAVESEFVPMQSQSGPWPGRRERFLHDLDGDGTPEIVLAGTGSLELFARRGALYAHALSLPILPRLRLAHAAHVQVWPEEARRLTFPIREMSCRLFVDGATVCVLSREEAPQAPLQPGTAYRIGRGGLVRGEEDTWRYEVRETAFSEVLPGHLRPCRLNGDDAIDYAGGRWESSEGGALPSLVYETWATLDSGKTFFVRRAHAFQGHQPHSSFLDYDGDGDVDMLTESTTVLLGGPREAIERYLTGRSLEHVIRVYPQEDGAFLRQPSLTHTARIQLEQAPVSNGPMFMRYQNGELINFTGDFNRDGWRDLALQDRLGRLAFFLGGEGGLPSRPHMTIPLPDGALFRVADVNGDGRSDIVLRWEEQGETAGPRCRLLFSEEGP